MQNASHALATAVAGHDLADIPHECRALARRGVLDAVACGLYGHTLPHVGWVGALASDGSGGSTATVWGQRRALPPAAAARANGTAVHATEMSETFIRAVVHPGNVVVPAALAVAEAEGSSGAELLTAVALGYELLIRCGFAAGPSTLLDQGLHTFSVLGTFGAAAAAAKLRFGGDRERIGHALGIAATLAPTTLLGAARDGDGVKDYYEGYACGLGVHAAELAALGVTGPRTWAETWFPAVLRRCDLGRLTDGLGQSWEMASGGLRIKLLPVMGLVQPTTVAVRDLLARSRIVPDEVCAITVDSTRRAVIADDPRPASVTAAKASIPFTVAALICRQDRWRDDPFLLDFFSDTLVHDADVLALAARCTVRVDDAFEHSFESSTEMKYESRVAVELYDGTSAESYADIWPATSGLTFDDLVPKVTACGRRSVTDEALTGVVDLLRRLEQVRDLDDLWRGLAGDLAAPPPPSGSQNDAAQP